MKIVCGENINEKCVICHRQGEIWYFDAQVDICFNFYMWILTLSRNDIAYAVNPMLAEEDQTK